MGVMHCTCSMINLLLLQLNLQDLTTNCGIKILKIYTKEHVHDRKYLLIKPTDDQRPFTQLKHFLKMIFDHQMGGLYPS